MTTSPQVEAVSAYRAQAAAALFPSLRQPQPALCQHDETAPAVRTDDRLEVPLSELSFRHLQSADDIAGITHLRKEIQLVAASGADPTFVAREKKETNRVL